MQTALTLGATQVQVIRTVLLPAALPEIFDSFRVMNAISWTYVILAEAVNPEHGLGYMVELARTHQKASWSFAGLLVIGGIGLLTDFVIRSISRIPLPLARGQRCECTRDTQRAAGEAGTVAVTVGDRSAAATPSYRGDAVSGTPKLRVESPERHVHRSLRTCHRGGARRLLRHRRQTGLRRDRRLPRSVRVRQVDDPEGRGRAAAADGG